jgi:Uma2 family endonuclease
MERMGNPLLAPGERFTYRHYRSWLDEERWELIDGQAWSMSPAPMREHQELSGKLFVEISVFLKGKPCKAYDAPFDVLLPGSEEEDDDEVDTVVQPDIVVFCDKSKLTKRGARGAPDWVIEILSPRTAKKDYEVKHRLYERHGVREYWIVDPKAEVIHAWRLGDDGRYGEERIYEDCEAAPSSVLEGLVIETRELFADLD